MLSLELKNIKKHYESGGGVTALQDVSLAFRKSEFVCVLGPSGCGKTTLLNIIGGLDSYSAGDMIINGVSTKGYKYASWDAYRNHNIGFVFQSYNLISHQTALANVEMALKISGETRADRKERAMAALTKVGLADQMGKRPNYMSGGQMQRVAIARALVNDPDIILADEPTGSLDSETSAQIMELMKEVAKDRLVIMVTHNQELAGQYGTRIVQLKDGRIVSDSDAPVIAEEQAGLSQKPQERSKLGFMTAMGLSFNNLLTKKGRTFLTAFAGAIGIVGIALILALSNGMNDYISRIESDTMGSYPIKLEKETIDFMGIMDPSNGGPGVIGAGTAQSAGADADAAQAPSGFSSNNIVASAVEADIELTTENNLGAFKEYLDSNYDEISSSVSAIEYGYDIVPQVFRVGGASVIQVSPSSLLDANSATMSMSGDPFDNAFDNAFGGGNRGIALGSSANSDWVQAVSNEGLRHRQYTLLEGSWPSACNEAALVINGNFEVSDYTLYTLGLMDIDEMDALVTAIKEGSAYDDPVMSFAYADALGLEFKVFAACDLYKPSAENAGVWIDMSTNLEYIADIYAEGLTITITAILQATDEAAISNGVLYTGELTEYLIDRAAGSDVVTQQQSNPDINVLTGNAFAEEADADSVDGTAEASSAEEVAAGTTDVSGASGANGESGVNGESGESGESTEDAASGQSGFAAGMAGMAGAYAGGETGLSDDQIAILIAQMSTTTPSSYQEVLDALGYADRLEPASIWLYPADFEAKSVIQQFIEGYNNQVASDLDRVTYTDMIGLMTSSISSIVDIISYVLIAFVAISLIVSSIMIAIITYVSVLERTREIGVLRALGASKGGVSKIFNAETFIEGLASGVIGIAVSLLLCLPINAIIYSLLGVAGIAALPLQYSLLLVAISVVLTFIAGFIPARMAARKDPVEALRAE